MSPLDLRLYAECADVQTVGIPRALLYYRYHVIWQTFFEQLDRRVVFSEPSNRAMLEEGEALSVDECCLASKLYMGHTAALLRGEGVAAGAGEDAPANIRPDALFVPSMDNLKLHEAFCTKFAALPDLVANTFADQQPRIVTCRVAKREDEIKESDAFIELGQRFGFSKKKAKDAYCEAVRAQERHDEKLHKALMCKLDAAEHAPEGERPLRLLLAAHPYVAHDPLMGGPITDFLDNLGVCTLHASHYGHKRALEKSFEFSDTLPWVINREIIGAALNLYNRIDGIVLVSAFPCGPDSMTNDAVLRCIKGKPILSLTVDSQSGTAGLETRIESFVDILHYQKKGGYLHE